MGGEPVVSSVKDVPNDQGGKVKVSWDRSPLDAWPDNRISNYLVYRSVPPNVALAALQYGVATPEARRDAMQDAVLKGEVVTRGLLERRGQTLKWFRHPYTHTGTTREIKDAFETFLASRQPSSGAALMRLGDAALQTGDFAGAAKRYAEYLERWPGSERRAEAGYLLAYSRYREGRYAEAAEAASRFAGQSGPFARDLARLRVALLKREGRLTEALAETDALAAGDGRDARARLERMKLLFQLGRLAELPGEAAALFSLAPDLAAADPYAFLLASYLRGLGQVTLKEWRAAAASLDVVNAPAADRAGLGAIVPWARCPCCSDARRHGLRDRARARCSG